MKEEAFMNKEKFFLGKLSFCLQETGLVLHYSSMRFKLILSMWRLRPMPGIQRFKNKEDIYDDL